MSQIFMACDSQLSDKMPRKPIEERKIRISVTVDPDVFDWMMSRVRDCTFANQSHAVGYCLRRIMEQEGEEQKRFRIERSEN